MINLVTEEINMIQKLIKKGWERNQEILVYKLLTINIIIIYKII